MISRTAEEKRHQDAMKDIMACAEPLVGTIEDMIKAENDQHQWTLGLIDEREKAVKRFAAMKRKVTTEFNKAVEPLIWWPGGYPLTTKVDGKYKGCDEYTDEDLARIRQDQEKYHQAEAIRNQKITAIETEEGEVLCRLAVLPVRQG